MFFQQLHTEVNVPVTNVHRIVNFGCVKFSRNDIYVRSLSVSKDILLKCKIF